MLWPGDPERRNVPMYHYREFVKGPESENLLWKTWLLGRFGAMIGGIASVYNLLYFPAETWKEGATRAMRTTTTYALAGATFAASTTVSAEMRGKEDEWNSVIGGCLAGVAVGAKMKSYQIAGGLCPVLGVLAGMNKHWRINDYPSDIDLLSRHE